MRRLIDHLRYMAESANMKPLVEESATGYDWRGDHWKQVNPESFKFIVPLMSWLKYLPMREPMKE